MRRSRATWLTWWLLSLPIISSCDVVESWVTTVTFDSTSKWFHVEVRLEDVGAAFFNCHDTDSCLVAIQQTLELEGENHITQHVANLPEMGANNVKLALESDESRLNLIVNYDALPGTEAANRTHVILTQQFQGMTRTEAQLIVEIDPPAKKVGDLPHRRTRFFVVGDKEKTGISTQVLETFTITPGRAWSRRGRRPIFKAMPDLEPALKRDGLL